MHTRIHIPPAVQSIKGARRWFCLGADNVRYWKRWANRRQRRYLNQLMDKICQEPELFDEEGFRGLPRPLTSWDLD